MGLRPQVVPFGGDEALLRRDGIELVQPAVCVCLIRGSSTSGLVHDIHRVALPQEELRPTLAAVRGTGEVGSRLRAAVNHDDGPRMRLTTRNLKLRIQMPAQYTAAVDRRV